VTARIDPANGRPSTDEKLFQSAPYCHRAFESFVTFLCMHRLKDRGHRAGNDKDTAKTWTKTEGRLTALLSFGADGIVLEKSFRAGFTVLGRTAWAQRGSLLMNHGRGRGVWKPCVSLCERRKVVASRHDYVSYSAEESPVE